MSAAVGARLGGRQQWLGQWFGEWAWHGMGAVVTSSLLLPSFPFPPDQDLVSEPPDEAQAAATGAEDRAFLQPHPALRTSERRYVLATHIRGADTTFAPARCSLWGLHLGGPASTHPGPQQRLQSTSYGLLGSTLLGRVQGSQSFLAGCLTL